MMQIDAGKTTEREWRALIDLAQILGVGHEATVSRAELVELAVERLKATGKGDFGEYLLQLREFVEKNNIPRDLPSRGRKAGEEAGELGEAVANHAYWGNKPFATLQSVREEAADLVNVGVDVLMITGRVEDVFACLTKNLADKAAKYDRGEARQGGAAVKRRITAGVAKVFFAPSVGRRYLTLKGAATAEARARIYSMFPVERGDEMGGGWDIRYDEPERWNRLLTRLVRVIMLQHRKAVKRG